MVKSRDEFLGSFMKDEYRGHNSLKSINWTKISGIHIQIMEHFKCLSIYVCGTRGNILPNIMTRCSYLKG
jgi:hypothetical protein